MLTDYEHMLISAVRYALGRRTYIVSLTVDYIINELPNLSRQCKQRMIDDIKKPLVGYGDNCDEKNWMRLLRELESEVQSE